MMRRLGRLFIAAALLAFGGAQLISPAVATHVQEPSVPVETLDVRLLHYSTQTPLFCAPDAASAENYSQQSLRIEATVGADAAPSEHFSVTFDIQRAQLANPNLTEPYWDAFWKHQNITPHGFGVPDAWEILQVNQYKMLERPGRWKVVVTVVGEISGTVLKDVCHFRVVTP